MADSPEQDPERLDLSAFEVPPPPPGLADRVLARLAPAPPRDASRRLRGLAAAACVLALLGVGGWLGLGREESGERSFTQRETVSLGRSALAVAEPGTELHWTAGRRGHVRVSQPAGRVFYRVEPGSDFQVDTPAGQVAVRGTCLTLEVQPMFVSKPSLTGAALGAALTAAVFVTVHEGRVAVTTSAGAREVGPGERVVMSAGATPHQLTASASPRGASAKPDVPAVPEGSDTRAPAPASWQAREATYVAELTHLRARVKELEASPAGSRTAPRDRKDLTWLEPSREELLEMAQHCKLRWDEPGLNPAMGMPSAEEMASKGLTQDEAEVMSEVHTSFVTHALEQLRAIYVAATGDVESSRVLSPEALELEILDKSPRATLKAAYQRVAQERAGLATPPDELARLTPVERLVRFNTSQGDAYEHALADKLGPTRARELRTRDGGWGSRHESSHGCPSGP